MSPPFLNLLILIVEIRFVKYSRKIHTYTVRETLREAKTFGAQPAPVCLSNRKIDLFVSMFYFV